MAPPRLTAVPTPTWALVPGRSIPSALITQKEGNDFEARRLFTSGPDNTQGRYAVGSSTSNPWGFNQHGLTGNAEVYAFRGPFYSPINGDACPADANGQKNTMRFPGGAGRTSFNCFPIYNNTYEGWTGNSRLNSPLMYNFFTPDAGYITSTVARARAATTKPGNWKRCTATATPARRRC